MAGERKSTRRKSLDSPIDLISDLPRNVIDVIVEFLPLLDAARLCVLSRKWLDIWRSTPYLCFSSYFLRSVLQNKRSLTHEFSGIVSKILFNHSGPILKFSLHVPPLNLPPDVNQWISFLSTSGIKEFSLENEYAMPLMLSSRLSSFAGLENLKLHHCVLSFPPSFSGFRKLVTLELRSVLFKEGTFGGLITKCPLLEKLSLINCSGIEHVDVDADGVKHLTVNGTFKSLCVKNAKNLVSVAIVLDKMTKICHKTSLRDLLVFLGSSSKLEKLCLGGYFCKVLFNEGLILTTFEILRCLELQSVCLDDMDSFSSAVRAIQRCPNVRNLSISVSMSSNLDTQALVYDPDIVMLHHLRHAKVWISNASTTELELIGFLLACSPVLEVLSVTFLRPIKASQQLRMSNQLIRFRRASPKVEVICPNTMITIESSDSSDDADVDSGTSDASSSSYTATSDSDLSASSDSA